MKQSGFAHVLPIIVLIAVFGGVGTVTYMSVTKNKQKAAEHSKIDATKDTTVDKKVATDPAPETTEPVVESTPAPTPAPAPAPKPAPQPLVAGDCTGTFSVYVIAEGGAPISYKSPDSWSTARTIPYGEQITIHCEIGYTAKSPEYALYEDAFIKTSQLSRTAP